MPKQAFLMLCCCSVMSDCVTIWTVVCQAPLSSVQFSCSVVSGSLQPLKSRLQSVRLLCPPLSSRICSSSCPLSQCCYLTVLSSAAPFFCCPRSFPAAVLPMNIQGWFPCYPRDSSPALQFESISSSALSLLYGPTLTSIHDYWKNHSFDYMDFITWNINW